MGRSTHGLLSGPTHCRSGFSRDVVGLRVCTESCVYDVDVNVVFAASGGNTEANNIAAEAAPTVGLVLLLHNHPEAHVEDLVVRGVVEPVVRGAELRPVIP